MLNKKNREKEKEVKVSQVKSMKIRANIKYSPFKKIETKYKKN